MFLIFFIFFVEKYLSQTEFMYRFLEISKNTIYIVTEPKKKTSNDGCFWCCDLADAYMDGL